MELRDASSGSVARIATQIGFNCYDFEAVVAQSSGSERIRVIDADPDFVRGGGRPSWNGVPILFPFPNRIRSGRYRWAGRDFEIPSSVAAHDDDGNAIHGFCLDQPWRVIEQTESVAVGEFQLSVDAPDRLACWPADFLIQVRYEVIGAALQANIRIVNPDDVLLPWGFGTHPYFRLPLGSNSQPQHCLVQAPVREQWELIDCLPTGVRKPMAPENDLRDGVYFGLSEFDDVFTIDAQNANTTDKEQATDSTDLSGLQSAERKPDRPHVQPGSRVECGIIDEEAGLQVIQRFGSVFRELVVFMPPGRNAVCLEPYTCVTDAINLESSVKGAGLRVLEPGEEFQTEIRIEAGLVIV